MRRRYKFSAFFVSYNFAIPKPTDEAQSLWKCFIVEKEHRNVFAIIQWYLL